MRISTEVDVIHSLRFKSSIKLPIRYHFGFEWMFIYDGFDRNWMIMEGTLAPGHREFGIITFIITPCAIQDTSI